MKYIIYCVNFHIQKDKYKHEGQILIKHLFAQNVIIRWEVLQEEYIRILLL